MSTARPVENNSLLSEQKNEESHGGNDFFHSATKQGDIKKIKRTCYLLRSHKDDEKHDKLLDKLFSQNKDKQNPLHVAAQNSEEAMEELLSVLPDQMLQLKLKEKDKTGYTPLHYACRHGNVEILTQIVAALSPFELYCMRIKTYDKEFIDLVKQNERELKVEDYQSVVNRRNKLFNGLAYFVQNSKREDKDIKKRAKDFDECVEMIRCGMPLPVEDESFQKKWGMFSSEQYHTLRENFSGASERELNEFEPVYLAAKKTLACFAEAKTSAAKVATIEQVSGVSFTPGKSYV